MTTIHVHERRVVDGRRVQQRVQRRAIVEDRFPLRVQWHQICGEKEQERVKTTEGLRIMNEWMLQLDKPHRHLSLVLPYFTAAQINERAPPSPLLLWLREEQNGRGRRGRRR